MDMEVNRNDHQIRIDDLDDASLEHFVKELANRQIHPVLLFGTAFSGKTTMLMSLLHYASNSVNSKIDIRYDEPDYFDNNPLWAERINEGRSYYEIGLFNFANRQLSGSTQKPFPFFIPIRIIVNGQILRFVFLEGNGEWVERKKIIDDNKSIFDDFKPEITHILKRFSNPISIIFVAPASAKPIDSLKNSDEGLANCITKYHSRNNGAHDNLLLLFSKWDWLCDPSLPDSGFSDTTVDKLLKKIEGRRYIWNRFSALQLRDRTTTKSLMPYSAAWIKDAGFEDYDSRFEPVFDKFNRTLWNWLYGNAKAALAPGSETRAVLYPDVDTRSNMASKIYLSIASTLLWIKPTGRRGEG